MKTVKPLPPLDELRRCFAVNPTCPSGLERIGAPSHRPGGRARVGKLGPTGGIGSDGYWRVTFKGSSYRIHRIIWALTHGRDPLDLVVDHRDGNHTNNHPDNLRACTTQQNLQNARKRGKGELPKGITKLRDETYQIQITINNQVHIATLDNLQAAKQYLNHRRKEYHGEFARS